MNRLDKTIPFIDDPFHIGMYDRITDPMTKAYVGRLQNVAREIQCILESPMPIQDINLSFLREFLDDAGFECKS